MKDCNYSITTEPPLTIRAGEGMMMIWSLLQLTALPWAELYHWITFISTTVSSVGTFSPPIWSADNSSSEGKLLTLFILSIITGKDKSQFWRPSWNARETIKTKQMTRTCRGNYILSLCLALSRIHYKWEAVLLLALSPAYPWLLPCYHPRLLVSAQ